MKFIKKRVVYLEILCIREDSVEKELAIRQLTLKDHSSKSWFISDKKYCINMDYLHLTN